MKERLDILLVREGLAASREKAKYGYDYRKADQHISARGGQKQPKLRRLHARLVHGRQYYVYHREKDDEIYEIACRFLEKIVHVSVLF